MQPLNAVGQIYRSFQITQYAPLEELPMTLVELVHRPTGARIIHLHAPDDENLFCLSFQTLPSSSNGAAHILEHTVLCGSKKFPVKDPFFSMNRRSLNTYMNALTGQDFTCYPASSQVEADFYNLLSVYLDAVFFPNLRKESFLQEGHRLCLSDPKDLASPLCIEGIVYNEMKGAMSSAEARMEELLHRHLLSDLPYAFNSGGSPGEIPRLTHEELCSFHSIFYHPSRALFFFYGNLPLTKHLDFLEKELFDTGHFAKEAPLAPLPAQTRLSAPIWVEDRYPALEAGKGDETLIAFSWLTTSIGKQEEVLALTLLESLLMETDASPLKKALLRSGLCKEADSSLDTEMSEIPFTLLCKGCKEKSAPALLEKIRTALETCAKKGFSEEEIEASLHQLEWERKEIGSGGIPYGLTLFFRSALLKQHGVETERGLLIHSLFSRLRANLKNPAFLPSLIRRFLLDNSHLVIATMHPDASLHQREKDEEKERLAALAKRLSQEDRQTIQKEMAHLASFQEASEKQSLSCLPKLSLSQVPPHAKTLEISQEKWGDLLVCHHACFTNGIVYADLVLELPSLSLEDLPLLSFYSRILAEIGCGGNSYEKTLALQQGATGGIWTSLGLHPSSKNPERLRPTLTLHGKAFAKNAPLLLQLYADMLQAPDLKDKNRLEELFEQHLSSLKHRLVHKALSYAAGLCIEKGSLCAAIQNQWSGFAYAKWIQAKGLPVFSALEKMAHLLASSPQAHLVLSCSDKDKEALSSVPSFLPQGGRKEEWENPQLFSQLSENSASFIPASVAYTAQGGKAPAYSSSDAPLLFLAAELLGNVSLHKAIREKGGAYGSGASYNPSNGTFYLYAYRDPHLARTLDAFSQALEAIRSEKFSGEELEEAKLCALQSLDAPVPVSQRAQLAHAWLLSERTWEMREAFRAALLAATPSRVARALNSLLETTPLTTATFLGKPLFEQEKEKLKRPFSILE